MSLSKDERLDNMDLAMGLMVEELGEHAIYQLFVDPEDERYQRIYPTTWEDLEVYSYIRPAHTMTSRNYRLTGGAWIRGLEVLGKMEETKARVGKVMSVMKNLIDGRKQAVFVSSEEIASAAGEPIGFIHNILESNFIRFELKRFSPKVHEGYYMEIPINFGHEVF